MSSEAPHLDIDLHGAGLGDALSVIRNNAVASGLQAPVPTCPGWTVRDLVVHLGVVQRWARAILTGQDPLRARDAHMAHEAQATATPDLLDWLDEGAVELLNALAVAPDDLEVMFFLENAPPPRRAWARRQCHEAMMHAVDAMSARLGRPPRADQLWFSSALALDGIDELLRGFLPRARSDLRSPHPRSVAIHARDDGAVHTWLLNIGDGPTQVSYLAGASPTEVRADDEVSAEAAPLYLALWNRGGDPPADVADPADWLSTWRDRMTVSWS